MKKPTIRELQNQILVIRNDHISEIDCLNAVSYDNNLEIKELKGTILVKNLEIEALEEIIQEKREQLFNHHVNEDRASLFSEKSLFQFWKWKRNYKKNN